MGSSDSHIESEKYKNNIYISNLFAKQELGQRKNDLGTLNHDKNIENENNQNNREIDSNRKYLNVNNDFDALNNGNRYNDNDIITSKSKSQLYNNNYFVAHTAEAIKMEITNQKKGLDYRKFKFNGITVIQNLKDYIPSNITKGELKEMIYNAFGEGLVDDERYFIPGKTVTRRQASAIVDLIEKYIKNDSNIENLKDNSILNGVNLVIDLVDLNKQIIKEKMFKGKNPSDLQLENTLKNLSQGLNNVKILSIEFQ